MNQLDQTDAREMWGRAKREITTLRKLLKSRVPGLHIRGGRGTASGWVDINGSGPYERPTPEQGRALMELGLTHHPQNGTSIAPDKRAYWITKLMFSTQERGNQ